MTYNPDHHPPGDLKRYHERTCAQSYGAFLRALEAGRWADALSFATTALAYVDVGYGGQLPKGADDHMVDAIDSLSTVDGKQVRDPNAQEVSA